MLTAGVKSYQYDAAGRTTRVTSPQGQTNMVYDHESRLTSITGPGISQSYAYNGLDTRVSKTHMGQTTTYQRDGAYVTNPVIGTVGGGVRTPGVSFSQNGTTVYEHSGLKNTAAQSTSGTSLSATRRYDAFGMVMSSTGTKPELGYEG